jgi:hypothetical protein
MAMTQYRPEIFSGDVDVEAGGNVFSPQDFQCPFYYSTAPFPARVAPWGDGKTLCMIMKGMALSHLYPDNHGLIIRTQYTALLNSTIQDFEKWTDLRVPGQKHVVNVTGTNSTIAFSHAESVEDFRKAIQGMNLGWAGIEQGDEMVDAAIFDMLAGRIRRIITPNRQIQEALIELGVMTEYVPDFRRLKKADRERIEKAIVEELGRPVRQIMVIANTNGHNWIWKRWKKHPSDGYELSEGKPFENTEHIPNTTFRMWESLKKTSPKKYNRYVLNSWEDYDIEGSYYAELMSDALKAGRVEMQGLYDTQVPVYTFWDLGVRASDTTAIWFVQFVGEEIRLIDYHEQHSKGMDYYSSVLSRKPYTYAAHYLPPDAAARMQGAQIDTRLRIMRALRREPVRLVERHHVEERIACVRGLLNKCKFDSKCERGVEALNNYKAKKYEVASTDETPVFSGKPAHDEWSNGADAFGYMAVVWRYQPPRGDDAFIDETEPLEYEQDWDAGITNLLRVG